MGRRGPAPTPTNILKLRGSSLVTKKRERNEVKGPEGAPACPDWLDGAGRAAWEQLVPLLETMGILTQVDANALARYCTLWARWRAAEQFIKERGDMYPLKDDAGNVKCFQQWPQVAIAHKLALVLTRMEAEFGMTPSARARLQTPTERKEASRDKRRYLDAG